MEYTNSQNNTDYTNVIAINKQTPNITYMRKYGNTVFHITSESGVSALENIAIQIISSRVNLED